MKTTIIGNGIDPKVHWEYFLTEFKKRFAHLNYKEESEHQDKEEQIILTIQSPSKNLGSLQVILSRYEITVSFPKIPFHIHFEPPLSIHHLAPDADPKIPPRINALDFIANIFEDRLFIRCYKRKGKIERAKVIHSLTNKAEESMSSLSWPLKTLFLKYEQEDRYWSGKTDK